MENDNKNDINLNNLNNQLTSNIEKYSGINIYKIQKECLCHYNRKK